jgi:shikimate dehydrogenase
MSELSVAIDVGVQRFIDAEVEGSVGSAALVARPPLAETADRAVHVAAIGTTAARAVRGELLARAIAARGFTLSSTTALDGPERLFADTDWQLGVVLSPWKQEIGRHCDALGPSAATTGVVDTVVRTPAGQVGFNTNTWAAMSALELVVGGARPSRVVLLGAGASARSVGLAVGRAWPTCDLVIASRSRPSAELLAEELGGTLLVDLPGDPTGGAEPLLVVNTTTWGETDASEAQPFGIDVDDLFAPGGRFFDLNNRIGALQHRALAAGCAVVSGSMMQRVTNACRAALLHYTVEA